MEPTPRKAGARHAYGWIPDLPDPNKRVYAPRLVPRGSNSFAARPIGGSAATLLVNGFNSTVTVAEDGTLNLSIRGLTDDEGGRVQFGFIAQGKDPAPAGAGFYPVLETVADKDGVASGSLILTRGLKIGWFGETVKAGTSMDLYAYDNAKASPAGYSQPVTVTITTFVPPPRVDLRPLCPPIVDQGSLGSCTANALAGALGFLEIKDGLPSQDFSRLYIYYNERAIEGTIGWDAGAQIYDGIKSLSVGHQGACYESTWPYDISKFTAAPPLAAYTEGESHEILVFESIQPVNNAYQISDLKDCLASGYPFVFGFSVFESFDSEEVALTGIVPMPLPGEVIVGGHAVPCVGYDDTTQRFICRNSWGQGWGQNGYFTMPYAFMGASWPAYISDLWTIRKGELMVANP